MKTTAFCCAATFVLGTLFYSGTEASTNTKSNAKTPVSSTRKPVKSAPQLKITRDNFETLELVQSGGIANIQFQLRVDEKTVQLHLGPRDARNLTRVASLSTAELKSLIKVLNDAHFTRIVGDYKQEGLYDGINEDVTLSLRQPGETESQTYTVSNYGDRAPQGFYKVTAFLRALKDRKFPPSPAD